MLVVYDRRYFDNRLDDGGMAGLWDFLGQIGSSGIQLLPGLFSGGSSGGVIKGVAATTAACNQALASAQQLLWAAQTNQLPVFQAASQAQDILSKLSNPAIIKQVTSGQDGAVLSRTKTQVQSIVRQIQALVTVPALAPAVTSASGSDAGTAAASVTSPAAAAANTIFGIDTTTLLLVGGGLLVLYLVKRK